MPDFVQLYDNGDLVDVTIRGAVLQYQGDHHLSLYVDGVDDPIVVPVHDDDGGPLPAIVVADAVPDVRKGQVWRSTKYGHLFFATQPVVGQADGLPGDGPVQLVMHNNDVMRVDQAVGVFGQLELIAEASYPQPAPGPTIDAVAPAALPSWPVTELDPRWDGYLRPVGERQPGDKEITPDLEEVPAPPALEPPAASEAATQILPMVTDEEPVR